ncbi:MAG: nucleotidyltransferase domain-containing protein [Candidatus Izemoplasmatales bacterium]
MKETILNKIKEIESKEKIKILFAVESGSRAWGFDSPDSDYDVRFIYIRRMKDYLRIDSPSDVLEYAIMENLDISGWDIKKTLILLKKSNPALFEWFSSPIVYYQTEYFDKLKLLSREFYDQKTMAFHYFNVFLTHYKKHIESKDIVRIKWYLYVLREIFSCKYVLDYNENPPMKFEQLLSIYPNDLAMVPIDHLLNQKRNSTTLKNVPLEQGIEDYILKSLDELPKRLATLIDKENQFDMLNDFLFKGVEWYEDEITKTRI